MPESAKYRIWNPSELQQMQIAKLFGVSASTVNRWGKSGCPRNDNGTYNLGAVCRWNREGGFNVKKVSQIDTVELLGVSKPGLNEWGRRGCPRNADRSYDLGEVVRWRFQELERRAQKARELSALDKIKLRKETTNADRAELELKERRGMLLPREPVVAGWVARYMAVKSGLVGIVGQLKRWGLNRKQRTTVEGAIRGLLQQLARGEVSLQIDPQVAKRVKELLVGDDADQG